MQRASLLSLALVAVSLGAAAQPPKPGVARYGDTVRKWHAPPKDETPRVDAAGRPLLVLAALNTGERGEFVAASVRGGFSASDLDRAAQVLRDSRSGDAHPVEPRLLDLVYDLETHFEAAEIRVVSGYRTPRAGTASNHGKGRAIDLVVPGATDADVATYARTLGFVGVGIYPTSGFVHLDVRDRSYYWSDASGPGRRNRERGILGDLAAKSDREAVQRGARPTPSFGLGLDVDAALRARIQPAVLADADDEDDDPPRPL